MVLAVPRSEVLARPDDTAEVLLIAHGPEARERVTDLSLNEDLKLILAIGILIAVYIFTRRVMVWRMGRAARRIIEDLEGQEAFDYASGVGLPYAERSWAKFGLRDYEGKALQGPVAAGAVVKTDDGRYFLKRGHGVPRNRSIPKVGVLQSKQ
jgi:hypothetical protein